jgi:hypothetical protein
VSISETEVNEAANTAHVSELKLPNTLPANAHGYEMIRVIEDMNDLDQHGAAKIHVALADDVDDAENLGAYLADVAWAVVRDCGDWLETDREGGDLFAALVEGFNERAMELKEVKS